MPLDLASRLIDEGLVSQTDLASALADTGTPSCLVARLVERGANSERILELFEAEFGLPVGPVALSGAPIELTMRLPADLAYAFHALPVAETAEFVIVALSNPSNSHAVAEISRVLGCEVRPRPARVGDLRQALLRAYPDGPPRSGAPSAAPLELTRAKPAPPLPTPPKTPREASPSPVQNRAPDVQSESDPEPVLLLSRPRSPKEPDSAEVQTPPKETAADGVSDTTQSPRRATKAGAEEDERPSRTFSKPMEKADAGSWGNLEPPEPAPTATQVELGPILAKIRDAEDRDEVVAAACRGALHFARTVVFLTLRRGVMRGWEARGGEVSADAVRNLWIPASSPSMFRQVLDGRDTYRGPYGSSAADHLYRAAIGSRGGSIEILPITVRGTVVALLCADEPADDTEALSVLSHAVSDALARIVAS